MIKKEAWEEVLRFNKQKTFKQQIEFLKDNDLFIIFLDNDDQYVTIDTEKIDDFLDEEDKEIFVDKVSDIINILKISGYFGWTDGIFDLFKAIGINAEGV